MILNVSSLAKHIAFPRVRPVLREWSASSILFHFRFQYDVRHVNSRGGESKLEAAPFGRAQSS